MTAAAVAGVSSLPPPGNIWKPPPFICKLSKAPYCGIIPECRIYDSAIPNLTYLCLQPCEPSVAQGSGRSG